MENQDIAKAIEELSNSEELSKLFKGVDLSDKSIKSELGNVIADSVNELKRNGIKNDEEAKKKAIQMGIEKVQKNAVLSKVQQNNNRRLPPQNAEWAKKIALILREKTDTSIAEGINPKKEWLLYVAPWALAVEDARKGTHTFTKQSVRDIPKQNLHLTKAVRSAKNKVTAMIEIPFGKDNKAVREVFYIDIAGDIEGTKYTN